MTERLRENVFKRLCDRGLAKSPAAWLLYKSVFLKYLRFVVGFRRFKCDEPCGMRLPTARANCPTLLIYPCSFTRSLPHDPVPLACQGSRSRKGRARTTGVGCLAMVEGTVASPSAS